MPSGAHRVFADSKPGKRRYLATIQKAVPLAPASFQPKKGDAAMPRPPANKSPRTDFGKRVFRARKLAKMTQKQLAAAIGCGQTNIAAAENRSDGSTLTVAIASATGVSVEWLASGTGEMFSNGLESPPMPRIGLTDAPDPREVVRALALLLEPLSGPKRRAIGSLLQSMVDDPALSACFESRHPVTCRVAQA
jgi:transcriptional regulator with XRE-family HTH domain